MKILIVCEGDGSMAIEGFLGAVSPRLAAGICRKLQVYEGLDDVHVTDSLKLLKPRIWGYKGTIYKLRVDNGRESARVMFTKNGAGDIVILHAFLKKTRKTPAKEARTAMDNLERLRSGADVVPFSL